MIGNDDPRAFPPGELITSHEFYDYEAKYIDPDGATFAIPARLDPQQSASLQSLAVAAYRAAALSGMARVDFFVEKDTGAMLLNEVNTIPGFTSISMFPMMCEAGGLSYHDLLEELVRLAMARRQSRTALHYDRV